MSRDWKSYLGDRTWPNEFRAISDKWGYLNNPRWKISPAAPVNYTGDESNEPQIWALPEDKAYSSDNSVVHNPCGHWHKTNDITPTGQDYEGQVYICDYAGHKVFVYSTSGTLIRVLDGSGIGNFAWPKHVTVYNDEVYITEKNGDIVITDLYGTYLREIDIVPYAPYFNDPESPRQVFIYNNEIYVVISSEYKIIVFNMNGDYVRYLDTPADGTAMIDGQIQASRWLDIYNGKLYASYNFKVQVLNPLITGIQTPSTSWGAWGNGDGQFYGIEGIVCYNDEVYCCDNNNLRIQVFDLSGNYLRQIGAGSYWGIAVFEDELYVADQSHAGVQVWSLDGVYKRGWFVSYGWVQGIYVYAIAV